MQPPGLEDIRQVSYLRSLDDAEAREFAHQLVARTYQARELVVLQDIECPGFYLVRSGKARIMRTGPDGREQTIRLIGPGDTFAEVPVFDRGPSPATVETLERTEVVCFPTEAFHALLRRRPEVALTVLDHFARRLRSFTEMIEQISLQTVPARLARYLFQLARVEGVPTGGGILVRREVTIHDLASLLGSVREVVSRHLKDFEDQGIIEVRRHEIVIRDLRALEDLI
jgi:CRP/FNR family transcriptional regulator